MSYFDNVNVGFTKKEYGGVVYYTVPAFEDFVDFAFCGDISNNLDFKVIRSATMEDMLYGYSTLCDALDMPFTKATMTEIVHGVDVAIIDESNMGCGVTKEKLPPCDALITSVPNIPIASTHADCMPIALYDKEHNVGCVIHSGWRGVFGRIIDNAIDTMVKTYSTNMDNLLVAIGPTILKCCFEVDKDLTAKFVDQFGTDDFVSYGDNKDKLDLLKIVLKSIEERNIPAQNVTIDGRCTCCDNSLHSYRRMKQDCGTMVQIMMIRE